MDKNTGSTVLDIVEIFESLQGEGGRAGDLSCFVRLAHCNLDCSFCDTIWNKPQRYLSLEQIRAQLSEYKSKWIIWTGGEPTLQLTDDIVEYFKHYGYKQAVETNGTNVVPGGIDYIACSPKIGTTTLRLNFPNGVDEFRYPVRFNQSIPNIGDLPRAAKYYLSPIFVGDKKVRKAMSKKNIDFCIEYIREHPEWSMSMQQHKIWDIR
jgi:organic radical activating enzyme